MYNAALIFSLAGSIVRNGFRKQEPKWIVAKPIMENDWNACITTLEGHTSEIYSVAWSYGMGEAARLASASRDEKVKIWEPTTVRSQVSVIERRS